MLITELQMDLQAWLGLFTFYSSVCCFSFEACFLIGRERRYGEGDSEIAV